jgi:branched-chain amino acid transport system permease protein
VLAAAMPALQPPAFYVSLLYLVFHWVALATSWNILSGYSGYFSFGHGAFFGAGVYTTATLAATGNWPFLWTLPVAGLVATALGLGVGAVVFRVRRLRGELFALLTLAVTFVLGTVVLNTGIDGGSGVYLSNVPVPKLFGSPGATIYVLGLAVALLALWTAWIVGRSRLGRGLFAIRDDEDVAEVMGVPTYRLKLVALGISCSLAGVAGGIQAIFVTYVTVAEVFAPTVPLFVVLMSVLGGVRHWMGPAVGAAFVTLLTYLFVGAEHAVIGRALTGLTLIVAILFVPQGLAGLVAHAVRGTARRTRRSRRRAEREFRDSAERAEPSQKNPDHPVRKAEPARVRSATAAPWPPAPELLLQCLGVRKAFHGVQAVAGVDLVVRQGEILGLVGPNGSGKSTLINLISGYYRVDGGRVVFEGRDLTPLAGHEIARLGVARTYQIPRPFAQQTVLDNVAVAAMFGAPVRDRVTAEREGHRWLEFVGLGERAAALPSELNLHQRKFLELARALAAEPRLVLLDEVLSGLTPSEIAGAVSLIRQIRDRGTTIVFVEHIMRAVVDVTDRLVVLNHGEVIAEGHPVEVLREPHVVTAYLGKARA